MGRRPKTSQKLGHSCGKIRKDEGSEEMSVVVVGGYDLPYVEIFGRKNGEQDQSFNFTPATLK